VTYGSIPAMVAGSWLSSKNPVPEFDPEYITHCFACGKEYKATRYGRYECPPCDVSWVDEAGYWQTDEAFDKYYQSLRNADKLNADKFSIDHVDFTKPFAPSSPA
jgi:hypothetical protein